MTAKQPLPVEGEVIDHNPKPVDMQAQIDALKAQLRQVMEAMEDKDAVIKQQNTQIKTLKAGKSGWLITAPNPLYDGETLGVQFINGQAFIPDDRVIPAFVFKPAKDHELEKLKPEERKAYREREQVPSCVRAAQAMQDDFGYTIQHFDGEDESLQSLLDARVKERAATQAILDQQAEGAAKANNLLQPTRFSTMPRG